jgi:beta-fructofuranosidase
LKTKSPTFPTRREFLAAAAATAAATMLPGDLSAQDESSSARNHAADPLRPQFHLLPAAGWMNDPNGTIYFNGKYHMFYQHNPFASVWGNMSWGHAISPDMIHWTHLPVALRPTPGTPDAFGCFSGSAIADGERVYAMYTGTVETTPDKATIRDGSDKVRESQCLAYSDDPDLIRWTKLAEPVVPDAPPGLNITGFRDPSLWKQDDWFYMTVGSGIARVGGCVLLYRSTDLKHWTYLHQLTSGRWNGTHTANPCDDGEMWECPELFPLDRGHVLIYSTQGKVFWTSGKLDAAAMVFHPLKTGELDLGAFYAPKTQLDAHGQRILWGWIPEKRPEAEYAAAGWAGMMSLPRVLHLDPDGNLRMTILPELSKLRGTSRQLFASSDGRIPQGCGEILCTTHPGVGAFELALKSGPDKKELLLVKYSPDTHSVEVDGNNISIAAGDSPHLHAYIDGSVIELIVNQRIGYTQRFYFEQATAPDVLVSLTTAPDAGLASLDVWTIQPISDNRLTGPMRRASSL